MMHYLFTYLINPIMKALLRSRFHGLVSDHLLLITFTGRKSGQRYTTPVGYDRDGDTLTVFSDSSWWKNLRGGAPVTVRLNGQTRPAYAEATDDPEPVTRAIRADMEEHGVAHARRRHRLPLDRDGMPDLAQIAEAAQGKALIRIELNGRM